ncbi:hypothetical protein QJQ45_019134 [Haematococcus lacustris]|nr:hypothetical protein QJQ45_019134 [Haematococcus lacustris]
MHSTSHWSAARGVLLAGLLLAAVAPGSNAAKTLADPDEPVSTLPCTCSDIDPRPYFTAVGALSVTAEPGGMQHAMFTPFGHSDTTLRDEEEQQQKDRSAVQLGSWSQDLPWVLGCYAAACYCQISCGGCTCCKPLAGVLADKGFKAFAWLLNLTSVGALVQQPGYMATLIAPHDKAVEDGLKSLGYSSLQAAQSDSNAASKLSNSALLHVVPPVPVIRALWTAPFMRGGEKMYTALTDGKNQSVPLTATTNSEGTRVKLEGARNSGWLYETDIFACKGYINAIDTMLLA